jgi:pimeloyl-ACP methyl ester carboxylesterase
MNDLFREYTGPVLIAQGALDPLNDAKSRAKIFADIRTGITVDLMPLGHCPMDENPAMVSPEYMYLPRIQIKIWIIIVTID